MNYKRESRLQGSGSTKFFKRKSHASMLEAVHHAADAKIYRLWL